MGKPAQQGGQSLNQVNRMVPSPPSNPVSLLAHRTEPETPQTTFITLWAGWTVMLENPGGGGCGMQLSLSWLCLPVQTRLGLVKGREPNLGGRGREDGEAKQASSPPLHPCHSIK